MKIEPYLMFNGRCEEAIAFYGDVLGARVIFQMRFADAPDKDCCPPGAEQDIMHATVEIGGNVLMMSDGRCDGELAFQGVSLSISVESLTEGEVLFSALADGGEIEMPFASTFWSPGFGLVRDRFGVSWMINVLDEAVTDSST